MPTRVLAVGAIILGLLLILLNDPPRTVCDTQLEVFREAQLRFLYQTSTKGVTRKPDIERQVEACRMGAGPGGCFELFERLKRLAVDLESIPRQCAEEAGNVPEIRRGVWEGLKIMIMVAWGEKPPLTYAQRYGWLDTSDVALFCRLKAQAIDFYGGETWMQFRDSITRELPQAAQLGREQVWQRSLVSTSCDNFR